MLYRLSGIIQGSRNPQILLRIYMSFKCNACTALHLAVPCTQLDSKRQQQQQQQDRLEINDCKMTRREPRWSGAEKLFKAEGRRKTVKLKQINSSSCLKSVICFHREREKNQALTLQTLFFVLTLNTVFLGKT